jgi:hypothetical protein
VTENIPQKILKHRQNLPWITNEIKTKMSKYKKKYKKYKLSGKCKDSNLKQMKANIQKEQKTAYTDRCISFFSKFQIVLTSESGYLSLISFSNLPKSLFIFSQFALEYLNIFWGFGWHLLKEVIHSI